MAHPSRLPRPVSPQLNLQGQAELCSFSARDTITGKGVTVGESRAVSSGPPAILCGGRGASLPGGGGKSEDRTTDRKGPLGPRDRAGLDSVPSNCMLRGSVIRFVF